MCGRFSLGLDTDRLVHELDIDVVTGEIRPSWNIAPTQEIAAIVRGADGLRLGALRWGLVPARAGDDGAAGRLINARAESVDRKPAFRESFRHRRCWIPADGFFEWRKEPDGTRTPFHFRRPDGRPFVMAGLWDRWRSPDGDVLHTCAILTTDASPIVAPVHHRMPVLLPDSTRRLWLDPDADPETLLQLLHDPAEPLDAVRVSSRVNHTAHDDPECVAPADSAGNIQRDTV